MLAQQRQQAIHEMVQRLGGVRVGDLVREFGVSDITIRRDLEALADKGLVAKVHGGATALNRHATDEPGFAVKSVRQRLEKQAIAAQAAALVQPGTAIALSAGTTTRVLAQLLQDVRDLTVVTNSIPVAEVFYKAQRPDQNLVLTGGIRTPSDALVGPFAVSAIRALNVDVLFLGTHGFSLQAGFTTPNLLEAETDRALVAAARSLVVCADHTKWELVGISTIAPLREANVLITDSGLPGPARNRLSSEVGELLVAEVAAVRGAPDPPTAA
ncbi:DeoR/GlpR family DNA-binding transcription regulator [Rugosimonospora acidiphila]|uniref:DeoR/GlpR family DNA-binding transcription regulator n=1 Tax=Rugosimonospora acidiphila TaxID=556531 RepID=A0ABP9RK52_9ACTN